MAKFADIINQLKEAKTQEAKIDLLTKALQESFVNADKLSTALEGVGDSAEAGSKKGAAGIRNLGTVAEQEARRANENFRKVEEQMNRVTGAVGRLHTAFKSGDIGQAFGKWSALPSFFQSAFDRTRDLNRELLRFGAATQTFADASKHIAAFRSNIVASASSMGLSVDQAMQYAQQMQEVGFSQDDITRKTFSANKELMNMKVIQAAGISAGMDFGESLKMVSDGMFDLGMSGKDASASVVRIGTAARDAGVSAKMLSPVVKNLMSDFKFLGMDVQSTTLMIATAGKGSKTARVDMELMGSALSRMKGMGTAGQAFFAMLGGMPGAGGKGAIGSGLAFEAAMAGYGGGPKAALGAMQTTLQRTSGGELVSREKVYQGKASTQEENRFFIQRQQIMSQMGMGREEAGKFMDIMDKVNRGVMSDKKANEEMAKLQSTEKDYAAQTLTVSQEMKNSLDRINNYVGGGVAKVLNFLQQTFGMSRQVAAGVAGAGAAAGQLLIERALKAVMGGRGAASAGGGIAEGVGGAALRGLGRAIPVVGGLAAAGMEGYAGWKESGIKGAIGGGGGGALGAIIGGAIGTAILPGIGTAIGASLGGIGGGKLGRWMTKGSDTDETKKIAEIQKISITEKIQNAEVGRDAQLIEANLLKAKLDGETKLSNKARANITARYEFLKIKEAEYQNLKEMQKFYGKDSNEREKMIAEKKATIKGMTGSSAIDNEMRKRAQNELKGMETFQGVQKATGILGKGASDALIKGINDSGIDTAKNTAAIANGVASFPADNGEALKKAVGPEYFDKITKSFIEASQKTELMKSIEAKVGEARGYDSKATGFKALGLAGNTDLTKMTLEQLQAADEATTKVAKSRKYKGKIFGDAQITQGGWINASTGDMLVDSQSLGQGIGGEKGSAIPELFNMSSRATTFGAGSTAAGARTFGGGRGEESQQIKILLEGTGVLEGVRKEIILAVQEGRIKGTAKAQNAVSK